jgi:hypothetical protein
MELPEGLGKLKKKKNQLSHRDSKPRNLPACIRAPQPPTLPCENIFDAGIFNRYNFLQAFSFKHCWQKAATRIN